MLALCLREAALRRRESPKELRRHQPGHPASQARRRPSWPATCATTYIDALGQQAFSALRASPGAHAYYKLQRARGAGHRAALRQLGNGLVGILHGCLKTRTNYNETTAWAHHQEDLESAA